MKILLMILFFTTGAAAKTIVENGVEYSCNPKVKKVAVKKPRKKKKVVVASAPMEKTVIVEVIKKIEAPKNIISGYVVRSQSGLKTSSNPASTSVETKYGLGLGVMYQRRVTDKIYLGAGVDTNSGTKLSVGVGY